MGWPMSIGAKYCGVGYADHGCCQVEYCAMVGHPINQPKVGVVRGVVVSNY